MTMMKPPPKVSVIMVTYNHEQFIAQAIESVLMQQTTFPYELVIGEDCSTDNTRSIAVEYQKQHPDKIHLLLPEKNLGMHENGRQTLAACLGEYIAMLDGDDYWIDTLKLQKQVDFLEAHAECSLCFHNVSIVSEDGITPPALWIASKMQPFLSLGEIIGRNPIHTSSVLLRRDALPRVLPRWMTELCTGDWPVWIMCAQRGRIGYLDEVLAAYRIHLGGTWSPKSFVRQREEVIYASLIIQKKLGLRFSTMARYRAVLRKEALDRLVEEKDYVRAGFHAWRLLGPATSDYLREMSRLFRIAMRGYFPTLWAACSSLKRRLFWRE